MEKILNFRRGPSYWISDQQLMILFASDVDWLPKLGSPNPGANELLGWYYLGCGWRGVTVPIWEDLPAPLTLCPLLFSSMVRLYFSGGSRMAALTVMLMMLSPPLVWAREIRRKCIPWRWPIVGCGVRNGVSFVIISRPGPLKIVIFSFWPPISIIRILSSFHSKGAWVLAHLMRVV